MSKEFEQFLNDVHSKCIGGGKRCPNCKGAGYTLHKVWIGQDAWDEPRYGTKLVPCTVCRETIIRIKKKYR